jgi:hypothetical protein
MRETGNWARRLAIVTGLVNQELLLQNGRQGIAAYAANDSFHVCPLPRSAVWIARP